MADDDPGDIRYEPLTPERLYDIYRKVLPTAQQGLELKEPYASEPAYQAALALWKCIFHPGQSNHTRLHAVKEFNERIYGKIFAANEAEKKNTDNTDLTLLSDEELAIFLKLLGKAQRKEDKNGKG